MKHISKSKLKKIKEIDLFTYLQNFDTERLQKISRNTYCIKDHDSLHISNGLWNWFSRGFGGRSALDFLIKVDNYTFMDAVNLIEAQTRGKSIDVKPQTTYTGKLDLHIPPRAKNSDKLITYLLSRGISKTVIDYCIQHFLIYQSDLNGYSNVCFLGYDRKVNLPKQISMRGINTCFIGEAAGSDKHYSFCIEPENKQCPVVHVFEGAIDVLSKATLFEMAGLKLNHQYLLSLNGVAIGKEKKNKKLPMALHQFLTDHPYVNQIIFHLDLDEVGRKATEQIIDTLNTNYLGYYCKDEPPKHYKDMNDSLCIELGIETTSRHDQ